MTEASLRRIHAVTRHYATLRGGVTRVIWVITCLAGAHALDFVPYGRGPVAGAIAVLGIFGAATGGMVAMIRIRRWMDHRFGRVRSGRDLLRGAVTVLALWGYMAGTYVDKRYVLSADAPSIVFLGSAALGTWLVLSLGRYGLHNLLPTIASLIAARALAGVDDQASFEVWQWNAIFVVALAWLTAGSIDFLLLSKTLGRPARGVADVA